MPKYQMNWIERAPRWCLVDANNPKEAKAKLLDGDVIEGTQDSDPGEMDKRTIHAEEIED